MGIVIDRDGDGADCVDLVACARTDPGSPVATIRAAILIHPTEGARDMNRLHGLTATLPVIVPNSFSGIGRYDPPSVSNTADRYETITDSDFEGSVMMIMRALMARDRRGISLVTTRVNPWLTRECNLN
jgi:hypothetical protein